MGLAYPPCSAFPTRHAHSEILARPMLYTEQKISTYNSVPLKSFECVTPFMSSISSPSIYISSLMLLQICLWYACGTAQYTEGCTFVPSVGHKQQVSYVRLFVTFYLVYAVYVHIECTISSPLSKRLAHSFCLILTIYRKPFCKASHYALLMLLQNLPSIFDTDMQL